MNPHAQFARLARWGLWLVLASGGCASRTVYQDSQVTHAHRWLAESCQQLCAGSSELKTAVAPSASRPSDYAAPVQPVAYVSPMQEPDHEQPIAPATSDAASRALTADATAAKTGGTMSLESLEMLAEQHNPAIQQATAAVSQAAGIRTQVGLSPNPSIGYFGEEIGNENSAGLQGAFLSQTIVSGDKLAWNRTVLGHDVQSICWLAQAQIYRVRNDIRVKFFEALGAQQRLELARQFRDVAEEGVEIAQALVRVQEGARPDVLQSEVQLGEVELAIQEAEYEYAAAWNELVAIAGKPDLAQVPLTGQLESTTVEREMESVYAAIVAESPVLAAALARVDRARANLQRQAVQPRPNLNAQIGAGYDDSTGDEFANVQLSFPIPVYNQNQGNLRAAHAEYCAATQNVRRIRMQIRRDLARAMRDFQVARATVRQCESLILPKVRETLQLVLEAQRAGEFDFLRVLMARRAFFDANLKYVSAQTDLAQANARIDGLLLTGGLDEVVNYNGTDEFRGAALSVQ